MFLTKSSGRRMSTEHQLLEDITPVIKRTQTLTQIKHVLSNICLVKKRKHRSIESFRVFLRRNKYPWNQQIYRLLTITVVCINIPQLLRIKPIDNTRVSKMPLEEAQVQVTMGLISGRVMIYSIAAGYGFKPANQSESMIKQLLNSELTLSQNNKRKESSNESRAIQALSHSQ